MSFRVAVKARREMARREMFVETLNVEIAVIGNLSFLFHSITSSSKCLMPIPSFSRSMPSYLSFVALFIIIIVSIKATYTNLRTNTKMKRLEPISIQGFHVFSL